MMIPIQFTGFTLGSARRSWQRWIIGCLWLACMAQGPVWAQEQGPPDKAGKEVGDLHGRNEGWYRTHQRIERLYLAASQLLYRAPLQAADSARLASRLAQSIDDRSGLGWALSYLGGAYWVLGKLDSSLLCFKQAEALAKESQDPMLEARMVSNLGLIYHKVDDFQRALNYYRASYPLYYRLDNPERKVVVNNNLGKVFLDMGQLDSAYHYSIEAYRLAQRHDVQNVLPINMLNLGEIYYRQGKIDSAYQMIDRLLTWQGADFDPRAKANAWRIQALILGQKTAYRPALPREAYRAALKAQEIAEDSENPRLRIEVLHTLVETEARIGRIADAYRHQATYVALKDSLRNQQTLDRLFLTTLEKELRDRQDRIETLQRERQLEQQEARAQRQLIYALGVALFLSALLAFTFFRQKRMRAKANWLLTQKNREIDQQRYQIQEKAKQLREFNYLKDQILTLLAHDLRSPLRNLAELININQENRLDAAQFQQFMPELSRRLKHTSSLMDGLLIWAEQQMEGVELERSPLELAPLVQRQIDLLQDQFERKGIALHTRVETGLSGYGNPHMTSVILHNLLTNALKFCRQGDSVTVLAAVHEPGELVLSVVDTGVGIAQEHQHKLFARKGFSTPGTQQEQGTGLGLTLCQEFAERQGGRIGVRSQPGQGSTFFFTLPLPA